MKRRSKPIKIKLLILSATAVSFFLVFNLLSYYFLWSIKTKVNTVAFQEFPLKQKINDIGNYTFFIIQKANDLNSLDANYARSEDFINKTVSEIEGLEIKILQNLDDSKRIVEKYNPDSSLTAESIDLFKDAHLENQEIFQNAKKRLLTNNESSNKFHIKRYIKAQKKYQIAIKKELDYITNLSSESLSNKIKSAILILVILSFLGVITTAIIFYFVFFKLIHPMDNAISIVQRISEGERDIIIPRAQLQEEEVLMYSIRKMINSVNKYEKILIDEKEKSLKSARAKNIFLSNISHELRTPLNALLGFTREESSKDQSKLGFDQIQANYEKISILSNKLYLLLVNLLDFIKIDQSQIEINQTTHEIDEVSKEIDEYFSDRTASKNLIIKFQNNCEHPIISGDGLRLKSIMVNILDLIIRECSDRTIRVTYETKDIFTTRIYVSNDALSSEVVEKMSQPFTAEHYTMKTYNSISFGVEYCKKICKQLNGSLSIERDNKNLYFDIKIPFKQMDSNTILKYDSLPRVGEDPYHILVADDSDDNLTLIKTFLKDQDFKISFAHNGKEAVDIYENSEKVDLVLMDIQMPIMDGHNATIKIREYERKNNLSETPILAITAFSTKEEKSRCYKSGFNSFLAKPIRKLDLINKIKENLMNKKQDVA